MRRDQRTAFRQLLEAREAELIQELQSREGIAVRAATDLQEQARGRAECELAVWRLNRASVLLRDVRAAVRRLEEGAFGICTRCGQDIGLRRLSAAPWASQCLECQQGEEQGARPASFYAHAA